MEEEAERPESLKNVFEFNLVRPIRCNLEFLSNPDGCVQLFQGDTCVVASSYGPTEVRLSKELPHRAAVDVLFRSKITGTAGQQGDPIMEERSIENTLVGILETIVYLENEPSRGYNVILQEYENDGSLLSCCINSAFLALIEIGCPMRSLIAAVTIMLTNDGKSMIVDPSLQQIKNGCSTMATFVINNRHELLLSRLIGKASDKSIKLCLVQALRAADEIFGFYHCLLRKKYSFLTPSSKVPTVTPEEKEQASSSTSQEDVKDVKMEVDIGQGDKESESDNSLVEISD